MAKLKIAMTLDVPSSVSRTELREYIADAIQSWGGQRHPDDHLFYKTKVVDLRFAPTIKFVPAKKKEIA